MEKKKDIVTILEKYRKFTNWTDWYVSGGCYTFADALYRFLNKKVKIWSIGDDKNRILDYVTVTGKVKWSYIKQTDLLGEHNYNISEANQINKFFNTHT